MTVESKEQLISEKYSNMQEYSLYENETCNAESPEIINENNTCIPNLCCCGFIKKINDLIFC